MKIEMSAEEIELVQWSLDWLVDQIVDAEEYVELDQILDQIQVRVGLGYLLKKFDELVES